MRRSIVRFVFIFSLLFSFQAFCDETLYGSFKVGAGDVTGDDDLETDPEVTYGLSAGVLFNKKIGVGVNLGYYGTKFTDTTVGEVKYSVSPILADLTVYMSDPTEGHSIYVGGLLGVAQITEETSATAKKSSSGFAVGGKVGLMFHLAPDFSLAPEFNFLQISTDGDSLQMWQGQAVLTIWI